MIALADIEAAPERIAELTPDEAGELAGRLAAINLALMVRLQTKPPQIGKERFLRLHEAARRLGQTPNWLQRHARQLPFATKTGKEWRFSESGIEKYITRKVG